MGGADSGSEGRYWWVGLLLAIVLGIVLLPTFPVWIALMLALWPVFLLVGIILGLIAMIRDR